MDIFVEVHCVILFFILTIKLCIMKKYPLNKSLENISGEIWVDVIGYDGYYEISNKARIKSLSRPMLSPKGIECYTKERIKAYKYRKIGNSITVYIVYSLDRINNVIPLANQVAMHFINGYNNQPIYYIDNNRMNCSVDNLKLVTEDNVFDLYNKSSIVPPNPVSEMLHYMGYKKCSICKHILDIDKFPNATRNRNKSNNCQGCINIKGNVRYHAKHIKARYNNQENKNLTN